MNKTNFMVVFGVLVVALVVSSSILVLALATGKGPIEFLFPVSQEKAVSIAQNQVAGFVQEVEVATINNPVHEVEIRDGDKETEVRVDANTGTVLSVEEEDAEEDEAEDVPITGSALDRASAVALAHIGEGRVTDTEVGDEEGYYEIEIRKDNGREVDVHLDENFKVLSVEN